jgi:hypothetical protein
MTPKEKAKELYNKCEDSITGLEGHEWWDSAKQCALICVDEILKLEPPELSYLEPFSKSYWQEVKNELNKQD